MSEIPNFDAEHDGTLGHDHSPASHDEELRMHISRVQAESALTPGPVGRLATIMNGLQLSDDPAIHVNELTYNGMAGWTLFRGDIAYPYSAGLTVDLTRSTSYCYDGTRMPPGNDDMRASVTRLPADKNASATAGGELAIVGPGVEEVGLRIYQRHSDGSWVMDGFFRRTYQPGEVRGAQHEWTTVSPEEADLILDRIFPTPPAIAPAP